MENPIERSRHYLGGLWTFLATGRDTAGQFALMRVLMRKGLEPPRHVHTQEDEYYYLLEGEVLFTIGEQEHTLQSGELIHLPRLIPHQFRLVSNTAQFLLQVHPAGLENMFIAMSQPAEKPELPALPGGPPSSAFLQKLQQLQQVHGIEAIDNSKIMTAS